MAVLRQSAYVIDVEPAGLWLTDRDGKTVWVIEREPWVQRGGAGAGAELGVAADVTRCTFEFRYPGRLVLGQALRWCSKFRLRVRRGGAGPGECGELYAKFEIRKSMLGHL